MAENHWYGSLEEVLEIDYNFDQIEDAMVLGERADPSCDPLKNKPEDEKIEGLSIFVDNCVDQYSHIEEIQAFEEVTEVVVPVVKPGRGRRGRPKHHLNEDQRRAKQKVVNKDSAKRYRDKMKVLDKHLDHRLKSLQKTNIELKSIVKSLKQRKSKIRVLFKKNKVPFPILSGFK